MLIGLPSNLLAPSGCNLLIHNFFLKVAKMTKAFKWHFSQNATHLESNQLLLFANALGNAFNNQ